MTNERSKADGFSLEKAQKPVIFSAQNLRKVLYRRKILSVLFGFTLYTRSINAYNQYGVINAHDKLNCSIKHFQRYARRTS